jgi:general secretion pathway protein F
MNAPSGGLAAGPVLADFILLNEEIAGLVRARVPLESHLAQIGAELPGKAGELAQGISRRLEAGESLLDAIEAECAGMPAAYRATILAGLASGEPASAIESVVDSATRLADMRRITGMAMIYPMIIIVVAVALTCVMCMILIPSINMLSESHSPTISWFMSWRLVLMRVVLVGGAVLLLGFVVWWWRTGRFRDTARALGWLALLPGSRGIFRWTQAATFADLLLLMTERGVPLDKAIRLSGDAIEDLELRSSAHQVAEHIARGGSVTINNDALTEQRAKFPLLLRLALFHSLNRESLVNSLRQAAIMYREHAARAAEWYAEYVPILLTIGIGGTLAIGFTLLVLWPYTSLLQELSNWHWR